MFRKPSLISIKHHKWLLVPQTRSFRSEHRTPKLQQFLRGFQIFSSFSPSFITKCGPGSLVAFRSAEGYKYLMRESNKTNQPELTIELYNECSKSLLQHYPGIIAELIKAYSLNNDVESLDYHFDQIFKAKNVGKNLIYSIMDALVSTNQFNKAFKFFQRIKELKIEPTIYMYNTLLRNADLETAKGLFYEIDNNLQPTVDTFNNLMLLFGRANRLNGVTSSITQIENYSLIPNTKTFEYFLKIFRNHFDHEINPIKYALEKMREYNVQPNSTILNEIILGFGKMGEIQKARELFYNSLKLQFKNKNQFVLIKSGTYLSLAAGYLLRDDVDECLELIEEMKKTRVLDELPNIYHSTIAICCKNDPLRAYTIFQKMKSDILTPSVLVYDDLISALCSDENHLIYADKIASLLYEVRTFYLTLTDGTYYKMLSLFSKVKYWDCIQVVVSEMIDNNLSIPVKTLPFLKEGPPEIMTEDFITRVQSSYQIPRTQPLR